MNTTNCWTFSNASCDRFAFSVSSSKKADVTVGNAVHVFQAFSFPFQPKNETVSQPVTVWNAGKVLDLSASRHEAIARVPFNVSEIFSSPKCNPQLFHLYFFNSTDRKYNVSVSSSYCFLVALFHIVCNMTKYSCVGLFLGASTCIVEVCFCGWWDHAVAVSGDEYFARNWSSFNLFGKNKNRSLLLSSFLKKLFQVEGNGAKGNTLRRWPCPRSFLVPAFKLSAI